MRTPFTTTLLSLTASLASASPGSLLSTGGSIERPGDVLAASVADDGTVLLAGLFHRVNSVSAPGVSRLLPDGSVDGGFRSGIGISPPEPPLLTGGPATTVVPCPVILQWNGVGILGDPPMGLPEELPVNLGEPLWFALDAGGAIAPRLFSGITPQEPVIPQFVEDGKLVAIVSTPDAATGQLVTKLRRLRMDTGRDDEGFSPGISGRPEQAVPSGGGGMWVLARDGGGPQMSLSRLNRAGAPAGDEPRPYTFGPSLFPLPGGRAALKSLSVSWDAERGGISISRLQFLNDDGTDGASRIFGENVAPVSIAPDDSVLVEDGLMRVPSGQWQTLKKERADGTRDAAFQPLRMRRTVHHVSGGKFLTDGTRRFLSDGRADPAWLTPQVMDHGIVRRLYAGPNGTVYGTGDFTQVDGQPRPGIARWLADGALDVSFAPAAAEGEAVDCAPDGGGSVAVLRRSGNDTTITRLLPDGREERVLSRREGIPFLEIEPLPDGAVLAQDAGGFYRFESSGLETWLLPRGFPSSGAAGLVALPDGRFFSDGRLWSVARGVDWNFAPGAGTASVPLAPVPGGRWLFLRNGRPAVLNATGSVEFEVPAAGLNSALSCAAAGPARTFYFAQHGLLTRHYADGRRDPAFRPVRLERRNESIPAEMPLLSALQNGGPANAHAMLLHPLTGALWIAGDFTRAGGAASPGLAVVSAEMPAGFSAWSAAIFSSAAQAAAEADPDADGASNWREYAAGTDPLASDAPAVAAEILTTQPLCVSAPLNPHAPEVIQVLEVSTDLRTWRTAGGAEAVRKTVNGRAAFELAPAAGPRFVRIRYRAMP